MNADLRREAATLEAEGISRKEIALRLGVRSSLLTLWLGRLDPVIATQHRTASRRADVRREKAAQLEAAGSSRVAIARQLGVTPGTVANWLGTHPPEVVIKRLISHAHRLADARRADPRRLEAEKLEAEGISRRAIARRLGVSSPTIGNWLGPLSDAVRDERVRFAPREYWDAQGGACKRIEAARMEAAGMSRAEIARRIGVNRSTVSRWLA